jgi:hypothetical protein
MVASMKMAVFWIAVAYSLVEVHQHFKDVRELLLDYIALKFSRQPSSYSSICSNRMRVTIKTQRSESFSLLGFKPSTSQI